MAAFGGMDTVVEISALSIRWDLGVFYYVAAIIVIVGVVNSTNLTDGIDGLASSVALVASMGLSLIGCLLTHGGAVMIGAVMIGGMIGFLVFNHHPAKVFMGDTGSLFLGGMLIGAGFMLGRPVLMLLLCGVFILDMLSSLIQIVSIRVFHRKVFGIAPVHHQFQKMHWTEQEIVYVFSFVGVIFGVIAVLLVVFGLRQF
jgi:phospho-N-acetylmuramoyl-pentapeptide-transferase